jgi:hypothetical protein
VASNQQDQKISNPDEGEDHRLLTEPEYNFKDNVAQPTVNFENHMDVLSETDDEEERLDCVHDIHHHFDGAEADGESEEEDNYYNVTNDTYHHEIETERRGHSRAEN